MIKYHILKNTDPSITTKTPTKKGDLTVFFEDNHKHNNVQLGHNNRIQRHTQLNHDFHNDFCNDGDFCNSHNQSEFLISDNHNKDHIHQNNNVNSNDTTGKTKQSAYNNNNSTASGTEKDLHTNTLKTHENRSNFTTSTENLTTPSGTEDSTMEIPLLQQSHNNNNSNNPSQKGNNYNNNKEQYDFEYVCLCQQKGFASDPNYLSTKTAKTKILWAIALCCIFMIVEILGGYLAGSLAIMTDAAHLASDCISFVISLVAIWMGKRPPDAKMSFGYKRLEVMGAIVSILGIWALTAALVLVAMQRIYTNEYDLDANTMMALSGIGILINVVMILILHTSVLNLPTGNIGTFHGHTHSDNHSHYGHSHSHSHYSTLDQRHSNDNSHLQTEFSTRSLLPTDSDADIHVTAATKAIDTGGVTSMELSSAPMELNGSLLQYQQNGHETNLNLRAAMIHVIGDLVQSLGVFVASVLIKTFPKAVILDPLCTLLFSIIVIMTTINLCKESIRLLLDSVPQGLSINELEMDLLHIEGVKAVHHLYVWNHTSNYTILMVHLVIDILTDSNTVLMKATHLAESAKYNIKHSTIQIERVTS